MTGAAPTALAYWPPRPSPPRWAPASARHRGDRAAQSPMRLAVAEDAAPDRGGHQPRMAAEARGATSQDRERTSPDLDSAKIFCLPMQHRSIRTPIES